MLSKSTEPDPSGNSLNKKKPKVWPPRQLTDSTYGLLTMDTTAITPMYSQCSTYNEYAWGFDHFQPATGKTLGIWPQKGVPSQSLWTGYRTKWGFTQILTVDHNEHQIANSSGYTDANIMAGIPGANYQYCIDNENAGMYYSDEPIERETFSINQLVNIETYMNLHRAGSKLMLGTCEYNPYLHPLFEYMSVLNQTSNTYIMCDKYYESDGDQRPIWTGFRESVGTRNPGNFIHSYWDGNEFAQLIGHANNHGINSLWFFIGSDGNANNIPTFCSYAFHNGWLRKFEGYFLIEWRCDASCEQCNQHYGEDWYIFQVLPMGQYREVFQ